MTVNKIHQQQIVKVKPNNSIDYPSKFISNNFDFKTRRSVKLPGTDLIHSAKWANA